MAFYEGKKFDVEIEELRDYKQKLNTVLIGKDQESEGSALWSINKAIALMEDSLLPEVPFLYTEVYAILQVHYGKGHAQLMAKFKGQFETFFKSILSGLLTKASKKLTKKKIPNG